MERKGHFSLCHFGPETRVLRCSLWFKCSFSLSLEAMDLYDDLDEVQASLEVDQLRESLVAEKKARAALETELADTQAQLSKMVAEKEALEQKISS